ncbi:MAG: 8-amino-7-oxononanoate synthase, partial [Planctomycetota bacterium]|nr:8-amino-7-oxononanoate synthase [Planctomycetota bacterium]
LHETGLDVIAAPNDSPIIAVLLRDDDFAVRVSQKMIAKGVLVPAVRPPTVANGTSRLRMSISCDHSEDQIRAAVYQLRDVVDSERR